MSNNQRHEGETVVITGGSSGIGFAVAKAAQELGAHRIVLIGRSPDKLKVAAEKLGDRAEIVPLDVSDEMAVESACKKIGSMHHLVTAAAGTYRSRITETDITAARLLFDVKFWGQHHFLKHGGPRIATGGSVTLFSGWISRKPSIGTSALAAVDGAIEALARVASLELAPVRVNAVTPGVIETPLWGARLNQQDFAAHFDAVGKTLPVGRSGKPEDVANAVLFLMSNGFISGAVLDIDGGQR